jgi:hypothetical protein
MQKIRDIETGQIFDGFPAIYKNTSPVNIHNMSLLGLEYFEYTPPSVSCPDLDSACVLFRSICASIESALEIDDFKGGFDEIFALTDAQHMVLREAGLTDKLNFADRLCNHEANKVGMQAPAWWYRCWE